MPIRQHNDGPKNHWRWLKHWNPQAQEAVDWACRQFAPETQQRGMSRAYYGFLWAMSEMLQTFSNGVSGLEVIDIGCGAGVLPLALSYLGARVTALDRFYEYEDDYNNQMGNTRDIVRRLQSNGIRVIRRDFIRDGLPAEPGMYDLVTFFEVIEHLPVSPKGVLQEVFCMLKAGGHLVVTTPNHAWIRTRLRLLVGRSVYHPLAEWWEAPFFGHVREYTLQELKCILAWSGFQVERATTGNWWHASSRIRSRKPGESDTWTTRFTLHSPERWLIGASLLVSALVPSLRYNMLAIGRKPET